MTDVYRVDVKGTGGSGSGPFLNSYYVGCDTGTPINNSSVVTAFKNFYTTLAPLYASTITWTVPSQITKLTTPPQLIAFTPQSTGGTSGSSQDPPQLALVVTWRTNLAGPSFRGRNYYGPLHANAAPAGVFGSSMTTPAQTGATALIAAIALIPAHALGVYSIYHNKVKRPTPVFTPVDSAVARSTCYTQRRRQIR